MRIIKTILKIIVAFIAIVLIAAIFIKKEYAVEKTITINKPKAEVFEYLKYLKNQENFSKWAKLDPAMKKSFSGTDATVGFTSYWEGNSKVGKGEQEIKGIIEGKKIDYELRFEKPMKDVMQGFISTDSKTDNETIVKWNMYGVSKYPKNIMNPFMDKLFGSDLQEGLDNLKKVLEGK